MKRYLAWVGRPNITHSKPHKTTGKYSLYGYLVMFRSRKERDFFVEHYTTGSVDIVIKTNLKKAKSAFYAGLSQFEFDDLIEYALDYSELSEFDLEM